MHSCNGKTALVTDAYRGTGRAAALALGKAGAQVLVHHHNRTRRAETVVEEILAAGGKAQAISSDLTTREGPHDLAHRTHHIVGERLDILVLTAAPSKVTTLEETSVDDLDTALAMNVRAPFFLVQQLLPILGRGSSIIFASAADVERTSQRCLCTEHAIANLLDHFAPLLASRGVRVNSITQSGSEPRSLPPAMSIDRGATLRPGPSHELGGAIAFLASSDAAEITGEAFRLSPKRSTHDKSVTSPRSSPSSTLTGGAPDVDDQSSR